MSREILVSFVTTMVQAILKDEKTQTRRPVKLNAEGRIQRGNTTWLPTDPNATAGCPIQPGDIIRVRESAQVLEIDSGRSELEIRYLADDTVRRVHLPPRLATPRKGARLANGTYREACRLGLRVVSVRLERLQDISDSDAFAEGIDRYEALAMPCSDGGVAVYSMLWESIYGNWDQNPWVWVFEFERLADSLQEAA